jgi:hypothetical protein
MINEQTHTGFGLPRVTCLWLITTTVALWLMFARWEVLVAFGITYVYLRCRLVSRRRESRGEGSITDRPT